MPVVATHDQAERQFKCATRGGLRDSHAPPGRRTDRLFGVLAGPQALTVRNTLTAAIEPAIADTL